MGSNPLFQDYNPIRRAFPELLPAGTVEDGYYYFKNKQEIFLAVLDSWLVGFDQALADVFSAGLAEEKLRRLGRLSVETAEGSTELMNLLFEFWAHASREETLMQMIGTAFRRYRESIAIVIKEGINRGEFRPVDPELTAIGLFAALDGLWAHWIFDRQGFSLLQASEALIENLLQGVKRR